MAAKKKATDKQLVVRAKTTNRSRKGTDRSLLKKKQRMSMVGELAKRLEKEPAFREELIDLFMDMAMGKVSQERADIMSKVRSMEVFKEIFNRIDGPLLKRQTINIRSDKTVILHDGPAIQIDVGEKEGEDGARDAGTF